MVALGDRPGHPSALVGLIGQERGRATGRGSYRASAGPGRSWPQGPQAFRLTPPRCPRCAGGYLLERVSASEHPGRLAALERVVSPEPVLTPEVAALAREVADRYAGTLADVLRLAI